MSLIICANELDETNFYNRHSNNQSAASFRNHLVNPMTIPRNAEVAVQSVKINKNGLIRITHDDVWYQFFNQNLRLPTTAGLTKQQNTTGCPIKCNLNMENEEPVLMVTADEFAERLTIGMKHGFPHPDMNPTTTKAEILRDTGTTGGGFKGFRMNYDYYPTPLTETFTADWAKLTEAYDMASTMTITGGTVGPTVITATATDDDADNHNVVWANEHPLSHQSGSMVVNITGQQTGTSFEYGFAVGLCRASVKSIEGVTEGKYDGQIPYGEDSWTGKYGSEEHYDYAVVAERINDDSTDLFLDVQQFGRNDDFSFDNPGMVDITYYDNVAGDFTTSIWTPPFVTEKGRYNMTTNIQHFDHLRFNIKNEIVTIEIMSSTGTGLSAVADEYYTLATFVAGNPKVSNPKPAGQICWNLYPKVRINESGKSMSITAFTGRDINNTTAANADESDWYLRMVNNGQQRKLIEMDMRPFNNPYDGQTPAEQYVQQTTSATGTDRVLDGYEMALVVSPDTVNYTSTPDANMKLKLGFLGRNVLDINAGIRTLQKIVYESDVVPNLIDFSSLFVRLDNFTQTSFNARISRPSKILYHLPRFDTSNRELGAGLYFEPSGGRVYISLNNTDEIPVNEFHLSLCDSRETLAKGLTGQTIIGLHIRPSQTPL